MSNEVIVQAPAVSMQDMQRLATSMVKAGMFGVKDVDQALTLMAIAVAEGRHPATVARDYDVIQGRQAKKAEAMQRDSLAAGMTTQWHELTDTACEATFSHPAGGTVRIRWDMDRAKQAGLAGKENWKKYPRAMLRSRVFSEGCRTVCPMATSGMYTPEEIRDIESEPADPVPMKDAVALTAAAPAREEIEAYINSMDCASLPKLEAAFTAAWRSTKDAPTRKIYKDTYEAMKGEILAAQQRDVSEIPE